MTYTAGTVLVVILRAPSLRNILPADQLDSIERSWALCMLVLEEFQRIGVPVAQKCIETLRKVHEDGEINRQTRSGKPVIFSIKYSKLTHALAVDPQMPDASVRTSTTQIIHALKVPVQFTSCNRMLLASLVFWRPTYNRTLKCPRLGGVN